MPGCGTGPGHLTLEQKPPFLWTARWRAGSKLAKCVCLSVSIRPTFSHNVTDMCRVEAQAALFRSLLAQPGVKPVSPRRVPTEVDAARLRTGAENLLASELDRAADRYNKCAAAAAV